MALSLEDKLLGEKLDNYCSSDDDDNDDDESNYEDAKEVLDDGETEQMPDFTQYQGFSTNTGPKGVINDWRQFKRLESENRERNMKERQALAKKLSLTCRSYLDDEKEKQKDEEFLEMMNDMDEEFIKEYREKRMEQMRKALESHPRFGTVINLESKTYVEAIDEEQPNVSVIVHVYNERVPACVTMDTCMVALARDYPRLKFCRISAKEARLSVKFAVDGVPAILAYRNKCLIGNFIQLSRELGDDFVSSDVESFLIEHGVLPSSESASQTARHQYSLTSSIPEVLTDEDSELD